jgi:cytochrome d ubiquinol oxidase subunit II
MDFIAVGIGADVPLILFYTWYAHYAFRGKRASSPERPGTPLGATDEH